MTPKPLLNHVKLRVQVQVRKTLDPDLRKVARLDLDWTLDSLVARASMPGASSGFDLFDIGMVVGFNVHQVNVFSVF